ncbi:MAG: hypothetical protein ACKOZX_09015 [Gammaproteobacteria bacterium]
MTHPRLPQDTERSEQRATLDDPSACALAPAGAEPGAGSRP